MKLHRTYWLCCMALAMLLAACANIGSPEGGPRDYTPPQVMKTTPAAGALNFKGNKVEITFDEIVNLKEQQKKVVISPAPKTQPLIRTVGKKVTIEFRDELEENTTYVIDFSNAIEDNNEGNQMDGYSFAFSTGDVIDTLAVSGIVLRANDLEPMQHVLVGLHSNLDDTAFTRLPLERVSRTNDLGKFTIRNLKAGTYHVFAINDVDGDYRMARTEDIAFLDTLVVPSVSEYTSMDTVFTFDRKIDTITAGTHTLYLPNDLLLCMFNENYRSHYIKNTSRPADNKLHLLFGAPNDTLPGLEVLRPAVHERDWFRVERNQDNDSLIYWITDSAMIKTDTIIVATTYLRTDSAEQLVEVTDTIRFGYRKPNAQVKEEEKKAKEREERAKRLAQLLEKQEKAASQDKELNEGELEELKELQRIDPADVPKLKMELAKSGTIDVGDSVIVRFDAPVADIKPSGNALFFHAGVAVAPAAGLIHGVVNHVLRNAVGEGTVALALDFAIESGLKVLAQVLADSLFCIALHTAVDGGIYAQAILVQVILGAVGFEVLVEPAVQRIVYPGDGIDLIICPVTVFAAFGLFGIHGAAQHIPQIWSQTGVVVLPFVVENNGQLLQ